jgi:predicted Fe-Mo cluster-binding NifX family protein
MMKIALINQDGVIEGQIPQADHIMVYDMELNTLMEYRGLETGMEPRADWLLTQQCEAAICSAVTPDMLASLNEYGIQVYQGEGLTVEEAIDAYIQNALGRFIVQAEGGCGCGGNCSCGAH